MRISLFAGLAVAIATLISAQSNADDLFGQNLFLFSLGNHSDRPEIYFTHSGFGTKIRQEFGVMEFYNGQGGIPIRYLNNAAHNALIIGSSSVGIGGSSQAGLTIYSDDTSDIENAKLLVRDDHTQSGLRTMLELRNNGPARFEFTNDTTHQTWAFQTNNADGFLINRLGSGGNEFSIRKSGMVTMGPGGKLNFVLDPAGNLQIDGALSQSSDRNKKEAFAEIDRQEILDRVSRIPIATWRYKDDPNGVRHIGPVAQDFYREFQVGKDDKTIAMVDADGVALASIQALTCRLDELSTVVAEKDRRLAEAEKQIAELNETVSILQNR